MAHDDALVPALKVTVDQQMLWTVVRLSGELDYGSCAELGDLLSVLISQAEQPRICVDLSTLMFCDSSGVACLVGAWKTAREARGALLVARPSELLSRRLAVMGVTSVLPMVDEVPGISGGPGMIPVSL